MARISDVEIAAVMQFVRVYHRTGNRKLRFELDTHGFSVWYSEPTCASELYPVYEVLGAF